MILSAASESTNKASIQRVTSRKSDIVPHETARRLGKTSSETWESQLVPKTLRPTGRVMARHWRHRGETLATLILVVFGYRKSALYALHDV